MKISLFTKRLALGVFMACISISSFAGDIHTDDHKSTLILQKNYSAAGEVYAHYTKITDDLINQGKVTNQVTYSCQDKYNVTIFGYNIHGATDTEDSHVHKIRVIMSPDEYDYLWDGWYPEGETLAFSKEYSIDARAIDATANNGHVTVTYEARWLLPAISGVTDDINETIYNREPIEKDVVFNVTETNAIDNFNYNPSMEEGFSVVKNEASLEQNSGTVTLKLCYNPIGIHTAYTPDVLSEVSTDECSPSRCSYTMTSKYHGTEEDRSNKIFSETFEWIVKEDYTPWFDMTSAECVFSPVVPGQSGTTIASGSIAPDVSDWNYAARQAAPELNEGEDNISDEDDFYQNGCVWKIKLTNNVNNYFSIDNELTADADGYYTVTVEKLTDAHQSLITFTPPVEGNTTNSVYTATLNVKCEYYDELGNIIYSKEKIGLGWSDSQLVRTVALTAHPLLTPSILLNNSENATLSFNNVVCGEPLKYNDGTSVVSKTVTYITNISDIVETITGSEYFDITPDREDKRIIVSLKDNVTPGTHTATVTITGTYTDEGSSEVETKTATLTVTANVILANPVLTGYAENNERDRMGDAVLEWSAVAGATKYVLYYQEGETIQAGQGIEVDCGTGSTTRIAGLTYDKTYAFVVVAKYNEQQKVLDASSNVLLLYPTNIPSKIMYANRVTPLYTGTKHTEDVHPNAGTFPYKTKRKVDVSAAFDAETQKALFNYIVIFALTTGADKGTYDEVTYGNARTPCYLYKRSGDEMSYNLFSEYQMNNNAKHPNFTFDASVGSVYVTGYCPYASTGTTWEENAVMHITGNGSHYFYLYLDNAEIYARSKKNATETTTASMQDFFPNFSTTTGGYMQGSGAVFAFTSTNGAFCPKIHLLGENLLQSCDGITLCGKYVYQVNSKKINNFCGTYTQASSPIQFLPCNLNASVEISVDNRWKTSASENLALGKLDLRVNAGSTAPLIDLGNEYSKVYFDGGYINFENTDGRQIAAYRKCVRTDANVKTEKTDISQERIIYGASTASTSYNGQDSNTSAKHDGNANKLLTTENCVAFNDGTFAATKPIKVHDNAEIQINGGSYICDFAHSSIINGYGKTVQKIEVSKDVITDEMASIENGLLVFKNGMVGFRKLLDKIYPETNWLDGVVNGHNHYASLSSYFDGATRNYGHSSLVFDSNNKIHLMLFKEGERTIKPWVVSGPQFTGEVANNNVTQGNAVTVYCPNQQVTDVFGKTHKILYAETDEYTNGAISSGYICNGLTINNIDFSTPVVGNASEYIVSDKVYMMKPIVATDWMLFCPPFDVANIYIIESYPENQLINDYSGGKWKIPQDSIAAARKAQAQRWMDLYLYWWYFTQKENSTEDFFVGENDYASYVRFWMNYEAGRDKYGKEPKSGTDYTPVIDKLCHFMGEEATYPGGQQWYNAAHYYLYESYGSWTNEGGTYKTAWNIVKTYPNGSNAIMKAGKVYALNFPYNTMGGHNPETTWDYWTGKYILIESTTKADGHTIQGSGVDMLGIKTVAEGEKAWLCGNPSFAITNPLDNDETQEQVWVVQNNRGSSDVEAGTIEINTHKMVPLASDASSNLKPTQAFLLAKPNERSNMRARTINYQTGEVTYETIEGEDDNNDPGIGTGIPTIMGDVSLLVVPTEEGITIIPRTAQRVMLFAADGKMLFNEHLSAEEHINVPTGVYIVRGEYEQVKAIKK